MLLVVEGHEPARYNPQRFRQPNDVYQLRISLVDVTPPIWRRLLVPQDIRLPGLHVVVQTAMGWTNSHLHQFKVGDVHLAEPSGEDYEPYPIDYRKIAFNQIARYPGSTCIYEYDFGDGWEHLIEVEDELPRKTLVGASDSRFLARSSTSSRRVLVKYRRGSARATRAEEVSRIMARR